MNFDFSAPTPQSSAGTPPAPHQQAFGLVVSGCPVRTDFAPVDASGLKFACRLTCPGDLPAPLAAISEVALFLLPNVPLPPGTGVMCYWQLTSTTPSSPGIEPPSTGFELLGVLTPDRPSRIFYTGWGEHTQMISVTTTPVVLTIGLSLEPTNNIENLAGTTTDDAGNVQRLQNRLSVARNIGADLFGFMQSFDTGTAGANNIVVPANIFDRWFQRFSNRLNRNPNFFLKQERE